MPRRHGSTPRGWHRRASPSRRATSALTARTVEGGVADQDAGPDRRPTPRTRLAGAIVDAVIELEPALPAETIPVVGDRRAATADRLGEDEVTCGDDAAALLARQPRRAPPGPYAGAEQDLVRIDVTQARHPSLVHQQRLDRRPPGAGEREERLGRERVIERVDPGPGLGGERRRVDHRHAAEATRVVVGDQAAVIELDHDVIVAPRGPVGRGERQLARHAEVDEPEPSIVEPDHHVFAAPGSTRGRAVHRTSSTADSTRGGGKKLRRETRNARRTSATAWMSTVVTP